MTPPFPKAWLLKSGLSMGSTAIPGSLSEIQDLRPCLRPTIQAPHLRRSPGVGYSYTWKFEKPPLEPQSPLHWPAEREKRAWSEDSPFFASLKSQMTGHSQSHSIGENKSHGHNRTQALWEMWFLTGQLSDSYHSILWSWEDRCWWTDISDAHTSSMSR